LSSSPRIAAASPSRLLRGAIVRGAHAPMQAPVQTETEGGDEPLTAAEVLARAQGQAAEIVADACRQADTLREAARAEGEREGRARGAEEFEHVVARLHALVQQMADARDGMLASVAGRVIDAIVQIAGVVAQRAITEDVQSLEAMVRQTLAVVQGDDRVVVRIHPDDAAVLAPARADLERACGMLVSFRPDRSVVRGGCVVETSRGLVDARLDSKLAAIHTALVGNGDAA